VRRDWRPAASPEALRLRARLLAQTRRFFAERGVLEVETPLLSAAAVPDLHLASLACRPATGGVRWLQTSPEYAMKRLLAAGAGPLYQITRAFRDGEAGRLHNPEFTILEWYRPGFDHHRLMDEMDAYLGALLGAGAAERRTYGEVFEAAVGLDPHRAAAAELAARARELGLGGVPGLDRDGWLQLLLAERAEPDLGRGRPVFLYDFPASQAALARLRRDDPGGPPVAERFEVYAEGIELANGFHELTDPAEQRRRFETDLERRRAAGLPAVPLDERFLAALEAGLPPSAGVALGFDRLVMLAAGAASLAEVLAFPWERA
jgi:lysyl-tRNA synthetase class 2